MQSLANFASAVADGIAVLLPALCYLAACACFLFAAWTLRSMAYHPQHPYRMRPWVPFVSLVLSGVFASFPHFLTMANVSMGTGVAASITSYAPGAPPDASGVLGATPADSVVNVVALFQRFFQMFGAACVFWALVTWRAIVNGRVEGSPLACGIKLLFGVLCINILPIATGVVSLFQTAG